MKEKIWNTYVRAAEYVSTCRRLRLHVRRRPSAMTVQELFFVGLEAVAVVAASFAIVYLAAILEGGAL